MPKKKKTYPNNPIEFELGVPYTDDALDYQIQYPFETPSAVRAKNNVGDVFSNAARCRSCGSYVRSKNRHDNRSCSCGAISVDGGSWYCKRSGNSELIDNMILMYKDVPDDDAQKRL